MLKDYLQIKTVSIVFLGDFNPAIVQPFWLVEKKLIKEQEAKDTNLELIHNELTKFDLGWASIELTKNRAVCMTSKEPYFGPLKDLMISIFTLLPETPIEALGINHVMDYALPSKEKHYEFGNKLAPLKLWSDFINDPKVLSFEIIEKERKDGLPGFTRVKIQPSDKDIQYGISISINDHFKLNPGEKGRNGELIRRLGSNWLSSFQRAEEIAENIWKKI